MKNNIILGTSNYDNAKSGNLVSITGDGGAAWGFTGNSYRRLSPRLNTYENYASSLEKLNELKSDVKYLKEYLEFRKKIEDEYIESFYETRLKKLDLYDLYDYFEKNYGDNVILLCHEPVDEFCHRRLVADYIELSTGIYIPEVKIDENDNIEYVKPIRYKKRLYKYYNRW